MHPPLGWRRRRPAFDRCYVNAIDMKLDTSHGLRRVEITCRNCGGHLGHVFLGEKATENDERHCVNGICLRYDASAAQPNDVKEVPPGLRLGGIPD